MASLRPEGALNSAKGLVEIGRSDDALDALYQVLSNRRYRQWNSTLEKIAEEFIHLCLSVGRPRHAKDGLIQYRNICQPNNLSSLEGILRLFLSLAEEKVRDTRSKLTPNLDGIVDLEETESGECLLISALSPDPAVAAERAARAALRDLWETLRTILEVCRNHSVLDEIYHGTAIKAFEFCSEFKRKNEFRRICETLRLHQQQLRTWGGAAILSAGNLTDPVARVLETRNTQIRIAIELGLWSVAFHTADEMYPLLVKKRPSNAQLVLYYSNLAQIMWNSSNPQQHQLFHAACLLKQFPLNKACADQTVLAVLAALVSDELLVVPDLHEFAAEKQARLATLCGGAPTRQTLMSDLVSKDVLSACSPNVADLFAAIAKDDLAKSLTCLDKIELTQYGPSLRRGLYVKTILHLQSMYSCVGFETFKSLTSAILPFESLGIRLLAQLKRTEQVNVCVDFETKTISFNSGASTASSDLCVLRNTARQIRGQLAEAAIVQASSLFDEPAFGSRLAAERRAVEERREATQARKEALEEEAVQKAQELSDQLARAEEERLEADAKARAVEQARKEALAKQLEEELVKARAVVDRMIHTGGPRAAEAAAWTDADLAKFGPDKLEQMHKDQLAAERIDRIAKRRNESRRLEYTARLVRGAENEKIQEWSESVFENDKASFAQIAADRAEEWTKAALSKREAVNALVPFGALLMGWKEEQISQHNQRVAAKAEERRAHLRGSPIAMSRDEFKEMAKSLPDWKEDELVNE